MTRSGRGQLLAKVVVVPVVSVEFVVGQIEAGEEFIFFEDEICDDGLLRPRPEIQGLQLLEAPHQECKLRLKRRAALAFIKRVQKWIAVRFHHALRVQALGQNARQCAFANPNRAFHSNVSGRFEKIGHELVL